MNLLCPNCQRMLTVPEEYAGQLMKCPLCAGTFTVPALPDTGAAPPAPSPFPAPSGPPEVYSIREDVEPYPPPPPPSETLAATQFEPAPAVPNLQPTAPAPEQPPMPTAPARADVEAPPGAAPAPRTPPPEGYRRAYTIWFSPQALRWVAPVAVVLIFILQFFPWVGIYPGGVPAVTQSAWGAAFGSWAPDPDLAKLPLIDREKKDQPGASVLTIFYLLIFVLFTLVPSVACVVLDFVRVKLPPGVQRLMPWRWGIVGALNLLVFFFLGLQMLAGFSIESSTKDLIEKQVESKEPLPTAEAKRADIIRGRELSSLHRTAWLGAATICHVLACVGAALMFWLDRRGPNRPLPRLELLW